MIVRAHFRRKGSGIHISFVIVVLKTEQVADMNGFCMPELQSYSGIGGTFQPPPAKRYMGKIIKGGAEGGKKNWEVHGPHLLDVASSPHPPRRRERLKRLSYLWVQ